MNAVAKLKERYLFLDGLRGVAALLVVIFHFNNQLKASDVFLFSKEFDWLFSQGHCGVEIFFIISGFVIAYSIRHQSINKNFVFNFFINRSIRLDPPYWAVLCLLLSVSLFSSMFKSESSPFLSFNEILFNFTYLADFTNSIRILPVSWTLALEIQFYLFFIVLIGFIQAFSRRFTNSDQSIDTTCSYSIFFLLMIISLLQNTSMKLLPEIPGLFIYHWYSFFIGCLICWSQQKMISSRFFWVNWASIGVYAFLIDFQAFETCLFSFAIYLVAMKDQMQNYLKSDFFQYFGKVSYSLYLTHWLIGVKIIDVALRRFTIESTEAFYLLLALTLVVTLLFNHLFYLYIEMPCLTLSRKFKKASVTASV